jgi:hypothetical protein
MPSPGGRRHGLTAAKRGRTVEAGSTLLQGRHARGRHAASRSPSTVHRRRHFAVVAREVAKAGRPTADKKPMSPSMSAESRAGEDAPELVRAVSPAEKRLEDQITWYDLKSPHNQRWFKAQKICQIVVAPAIPVAAAAPHPCG